MNYSFDSFPVNTAYNQLDELALNLFKKRISETGRYISNGDLFVDFEKLGLIINGKLTRAAQLLYGTHHTSNHIGRFKSADTIIDDLVIRSPLVLAVEEAMNFIKRNITLSYTFTGELKRVERWQFPLQAVRELLLNAVVHKDYTNPTDVIVKIFDSSIEISNPGRLMSGLTVDDLLTDSYQARHRNKLLAESFYLTGDIEKYGTGFIRIRKWLTDYSELNYHFFDLKDFIRVTLTLNANKSVENVIDDTNDIDKVTDKVTDNVGGNVGGNVGDNVGDNVGNNRLINILILINQNNQISAKQLAKLLSVSNRTIERDIEKLKDIGRLKRIGNEKTGHWEII